MQMQVCSMSCVDRVNCSHTVGEFALSRTLVCAITIYAVISFGACTQTRDVFECVSTAAMYMCRRLRMQKYHERISEERKRRNKIIHNSFVSIVVCRMCVCVMFIATTTN